MPFTKPGTFARHTKPTHTSQPCKRPALFLRFRDTPLLRWTHTSIQMTHKQNNRYGLTFSNSNNQDKLGIYLGTYNQASQSHLLSSIDTGSLYTALVDPSVSTINGINLGVKEINLNGKTIFKESNKFNLIGGLIFTTLGLVGHFVIAKYKRNKNAS